MAELDGRRHPHRPRADDEHRRLDDLLSLARHRVSSRVDRYFGSGLLKDAMLESATAAQKMAK
jgi:hypothetical protein